MITRWLGRRLALKGGVTAEVVDVEMCANQRVNLALRTPTGRLYLTTNELLHNLAD